MNIVLQISTAQGPAECRMFAAFVLQQLLTDAAKSAVQAEMLSEQREKHGITSAIVQLSGKHADTVAQAWQGSLQWVCPSPLRPKHPRKNWFIGVLRLPEQPAAPPGLENEVVFQTCRAGGKGGQHVNKTESAVRALHTASGIAVRVESERSQHANKKQALRLLALKLAEHHAAQHSAYAQAQHNRLYQVERGNPVRTFIGLNFKEKG